MCDIVGNTFNYATSLEEKYAEIFRPHKTYTKIATTQWNRSINLLTGMQVLISKPHQLQVPISNIIRYAIQRKRAGN